MTRHDSAAPASIHDRALDQIRYIRSTLDSAGPFTVVPGVGGVAMGVVGLCAAAVAATETADPVRWLVIWLSAAAVATTIGVVSMVRKSRRADMALTSAPMRRFALAFFPAIFAGGVLSVALIMRGAFDLLPPLWLMLYGVAVAGGGAMSVRVVPIMGMVLIAIGLLALFVPFSTANLLLGLGFGVVEVAVGVVIIRRYGG